MKMSNQDLKLKKVTLSPEWIDLSYGEPKVITKALYRQLNRFASKFTMPNLSSIEKWEYQPAEGNREFVEFLEEEYKAQVVVCNGAKQALAASLYALSKQGVQEIYYNSPYYPANPSLTKAAGIDISTDPDANAVIITSPNNPDGKNLSNEDLLKLAGDRYAIHDAAYYTKLYLPENQELVKVGDIQVYSLSKMYGLSGLRIGYAVVHNKRLYQDVVDYIELATAGVSAPSQELAFSIETYFKEHPEYLENFYREARESLTLSREALKKLDPDVLEVMPTNCNSMFAWCKVGPKLNYKDAKVYMLEGSLFGEPGMMRINIAYPPEIIAEAVNRLNKHKF